MDVLQQVHVLGRNLADCAVGAIRGRRTVSVYLSNSTKDTFSIASEPQVKGGTTCTPSFTQLPPGQAGCIRFSNHGEVQGSVTMHIGGDKLLCKVFNGSMGSPSVKLSFADMAKGESFAVAQSEDSRKEELIKIGDMPIRMSSNAKIKVEGFRAHSKGSNLSAVVTKRHGTVDYTAHVVISPTAESEADKVTATCLILTSTLYTAQLMRFTLWCMKNAPECFGAAVFIMELVAVEAGLDGMDLVDQAFMLNLLVKGFILSGALDALGLKLEANIEQWRSKVPEFLGKDASDGVSRYEDYQNAAAVEVRPAMEACAEAALVILRTIGVQIATHAQVSQAVDAWIESGNSLEIKPSNTTMRRNSQSSLGDGDNFRVLNEHLSKNGKQKDANGKRNGDTNPSAPEKEDSSKATLESVMMTLVRGCIHDSAEFTQNNTKIFEALGESVPDVGRGLLENYHAWVPGALRSFPSDEAEELVKVGGAQRKKGCCRRCCRCCCQRRKAIGDGASKGTCTSWSAEVFAGLDGGEAASPSQLLQSLGREAPPFRVLSTNSKSGEFFFFTGDGRYLVKTVSEAEGRLLFRMLPGYQGHMRRNKRSLIVRYAGLYRVQLDDGNATWITVMASVFEQAKPIHLSYDLKGSMHGRKKKESEKVGKDQDWIEQKTCLKLSQNVRREFCAMHEQDASFLMSYGVMDYSLLVGFHNLPEIAKSKAHHGWREDGAGLWSEEGDKIYFAGMIDFLIAYDFKKQGEHIMRVLQNHAKDASCVDPVTYARRNVHFIREHVVGFSEDSSMDDVGTLGSLVVTIESAKDLVNMDALSKSDPYATVSLGLLRLETPVIKDNLNPVWNCILTVPVDIAHERMEITLDLWDEDTHRKLQGKDDHLGRISLPLRRVLQEGVVSLDEVLQGTKSGTLKAQLQWRPREENI